VADWVTISSLATAGGTLVLATATFASVRSANRAARVAEQSLLAGIRPLLVPSRLEDPDLKVGFIDDHWVRVPGGCGSAEVDGDVIYLTTSVRNVGNGIAVQHGWRVELAPDLSARDHPPLDSFRRLTRDLFIAAGDLASGRVRSATATTATSTSSPRRSPTASTSSSTCSTATRRAGSARSPATG
jgi:hypothetical protein